MGIGVPGAHMVGADGGLVTSSDDGRSAGRTHAASGEGVWETTAFGREAVDVGRLRNRVAVTTEARVGVFHRTPEDVWTGVAHRFLFLLRIVHDCRNRSLRGGYL